MTQPTDRANPTADIGPLPERLERALSGSLPCIQCRYDLRGVSIRGVCPECGTAVRASILARVDPSAAALQPIERSWLVAAGLVVWVASMLAAVLVNWLSVLHQLVTNWTIPGGQSVVQGRAGVVAAGLIALAGLAVIAICRPHRAVPVWMTVCALVGAALHAPLAYVAMMLGETSGKAIGGLQVLTFWEPAPVRTHERWIAWLLAIAIIALVRPVARTLVARSITIRSGRVDRQTMIAIAAAIALVFLGDGLGLAGAGSQSPSSPLTIVGAILVLIGAALLTIGLVSSLVDVVRIARAVVSPGPSPEQLGLVGGGDAEGESPLPRESPA